MTNRQFWKLHFLLLVCILIIGTCNVYGQVTTTNTGYSTTNVKEHHGDPHKKKTVKKRKKGKAYKNSVPRKRKHYNCKQLHRKVKRGRSLTH